MSEVTIRELRNRGGAVIEEVGRGGTLTVTRDGKPVAELRPIPRHPLKAKTLLERWRQLPPVNADKLKADIDATLDSQV